MLSAKLLSHFSVFDNHFFGINHGSLGFRGLDLLTNNNRKRTRE